MRLLVMMVDASEVVIEKHFIELRDSTAELIRRNVNITACPVVRLELIWDPEPVGQISIRPGIRPGGI